MLRIGIIGADNFHALAFARLANLPVQEGGSGLPVRVTALWGESEARAAFVAKEAQIPTIVQTQAELLGTVDAVMIVLRHGAQHCAAALPFLHAGIPVWVDKPFTIDYAQANILVDAAKKSGTILAGGSTCKYCPDVLAAKAEFDALCAQDTVISGAFNFPGEIDSPYGGLYFYGGHAVEILTTIFGTDVLSVKADVTAGNVIAIFKYANRAVSVNFSEVTQFFCTLYAPQKTITMPIDITTVYRQGFAKFVNALLQNKAPEPAESLLRPVRILNALVAATVSEREEWIQQN
ncbi:MAG: Gfo/Idh/MocA family oxidoreductase [Ruthenibacterium sp.]